MIQNYMLQNFCKCPQCSRIYLFEGIKATDVYELEKLQQGYTIECKCGNLDRFQYFIVYTDIEVDQLTNNVEYIREMPLPDREVRRCEECLRIISYNKKANKLGIFRCVANPFKNS